MEKRSSLAIFKNDKGDNDKRPDYRGNIELTEDDVKKLVFNDGIAKLKASLWLRESKGGMKFMSGPIEPDEVRSFDSGSSAMTPEELPF
jgi:hypothetical protein